MSSLQASITWRNVPHEWLQLNFSTLFTPLSLRYLPIDTESQYVDIIAWVAQ